jgi:hypothetical protein
MAVVFGIDETAMVVWNPRPQVHCGTRHTWTFIIKHMHLYYYQLAARIIIRLLYSFFLLANISLICKEQYISNTFYKQFMQSDLWT